MRNHILGVLHNHPEWRSSLAPFELEGCLIIGDWENVASALRVSNPEDPATVFATVAQALQNTTNTDIGAVFRSARNRLGSEVVAAGQESYRRVYDAVANLHILHELESINRLDRSGDPKAAQSLQDRLDARLQALSPTFRIQEQVLSMRRTAFRLL